MDSRESLKSDPLFDIYSLTSPFNDHFGKFKEKRLRCLYPDWRPTDNILTVVQNSETDVLLQATPLFLILNTEDKKCSWE